MKNSKIKVHGERFLTPIGVGAAKKIKTMACVLMVVLFIANNAVVLGANYIYSAQSTFDGTAGDEFPRPVEYPSGTVTIGAYPNGGNTTVSYGVGLGGWNYFGNNAVLSSATQENKRKFIATLQGPTGIGIKSDDDKSAKFSSKQIYSDSLWTLFRKNITLADLTAIENANENLIFEFSIMAMDNYTDKVFKLQCNNSDSYLQLGKLITFQKDTNNILVGTNTSFPSGQYEVNRWYRIAVVVQKPPVAGSNADTIKEVYINGNPITLNQTDQKTLGTLNGSDFESVLMLGFYHDKMNKTDSDGTTPLESTMYIDDVKAYTATAFASANANAVAPIPSNPDFFVDQANQTVSVANGTTRGQLLSAFSFGTKTGKIYDIDDTTNTFTEITEDNTVLDENAYLVVIAADGLTHQYYKVVEPTPVIAPEIGNFDNFTTTPPGIGNLKTQRGTNVANHTITTDLGGWNTFSFFNSGTRDFQDSIDASLTPALGVGGKTPDDRSAKLTATSTRISTFTYLEKSGLSDLTSSGGTQVFDFNFRPMDNYTNKIVLLRSNGATGSNSDLARLLVFQKDTYNICAGYNIATPVGKYKPGEWYRVSAVVQKGADNTNQNTLKELYINGILVAQNESLGANITSSKLTHEYASTILFAIHDKNTTDSEGNPLESSLYFDDVRTYRGDFDSNGTIATVTSAEYDVNDTNSTIKVAYGTSVAQLKANISGDYKIYRRDSNNEYTNVADSENVTGNDIVLVAKSEDGITHRAYQVTFGIDGYEFYNGANRITDQDNLTAGDISVKLRFDNMTGNARNVRLIMAVYNGATLESVKFSDQTSVAGQSILTLETDSVTIPEQNITNYKIKAFIVDSLDTMQPLAKTLTLDSTGIN